MARTSAAFVLTILAVLAGLVGTLLLTVTDPVMQALFGSQLWVADTAMGSDLLTWQMNVWTYWPAFILFGIMILVWVETRQPT